MLPEGKGYRTRHFADNVSEVCWKTDNAANVDAGRGLC
jgi:hypothetical protein